MLKQTNQLDVSPSDYKLLQSQFNLNMVELANAQVSLLGQIPQEIGRIATLTESLANISIISGECYFSKDMSKFEIVESDGMVFDAKTNILKLKPSSVYRVEAQEGKNRLITSQDRRVLDAQRKALSDIDAMLVRDETIAIITEEQHYHYTFHISFGDLKAFNLLTLKLNPETLSYPKISEVYIIDRENQKRSLRVLNSPYKVFDTDLNKNSANIYTLDVEMTESDGVYVVLEDAGLDLLVDSLKVEFAEHSPRGHIVFKALTEDLPVLKVGAEGLASSQNIKLFVSHDKESWNPLDLSNTYTTRQVNKVVSWNTISPGAISTAEDVRDVYLRVEMEAEGKELKATPKIDREMHSSRSFSLPSGIDSMSLYEYLDPVHYGEKTLSHRFNNSCLYDRGEYLLIDNKHYIKGFVETPTSKVNESTYSYSPVTLSTKEMRVGGKVIGFQGIDISTKNLYAYKTQTLTKNLLDLTGLECVIEMNPKFKPDIYTLKQGDAIIPIDLTCGYVKSVLEVLFTVNPDSPIRVLDGFGHLIDTLDDKIVLGEGIYAISLLDSVLFEGKAEGYSRTYPITPVINSELGLLDGNISTLDRDRLVSITVLNKTLLHTKDSISNMNQNVATVLSEEIMKLHQGSGHQVLKDSTVFNLQSPAIVRGSLVLSDPTYREIPYINGNTEFREVLTKTLDINLPSTTGDIIQELSEPGILPETVTLMLRSPYVVSHRVEKVGDTWQVIITPSVIGSPLDLTVTYSFVSQGSQRLYSVDYQKGVIWFSERIREALETSYRYDRMLVTGKKAKQLDPRGFNSFAGRVHINNLTEGSEISCLFTKKDSRLQTISPILQDLKVNYITLDRRSL